MTNSTKTGTPCSPQLQHHESLRLATLSDVRLVELVRQDFEAAFDQIVKRYRQPLVRYCARRFNATCAEDTVQQALLKAYTWMRRNDRPIQLKPWLYRITHNLLLNALSRDAFDYYELDENFDGVVQPPQVLEQQQEIRDLAARIASLPPRQRTALVLRELEGRSHREIAYSLNASVPGVRSLISRARTQLRSLRGY